MIYCSYNIGCKVFSKSLNQHYPVRVQITRRAHSVWLEQQSWLCSFSFFNMLAIPKRHSMITDLKILTEQKTVIKNDLTVFVFMCLCDSFMHIMRSHDIRLSNMGFIREIFSSLFNSIVKSLSLVMIMGHSFTCEILTHLIVSN